VDSRLQERLGKWHKQIDTVKDIEDQYFAYEATEKSLESDLFLLLKAPVFKNECPRFTPLLSGKTLKRNTQN